jgi:hypothetical protein
MNVGQGEQGVGIALGGELIDDQQRLGIAAGLGERESLCERGVNLGHPRFMPAFPARFQRWG